MFQVLFIEPAGGRVAIKRSVLADPEEGCDLLRHEIVAVVAPQEVEKTLARLIEEANGIPVEDVVWPSEEVDDGDH